MKNNLWRRTGACILAAALCTGLCTGVLAYAKDMDPEAPETEEQSFQTEERQAAASGLKAPRVENGMRVWDCITFGTYPQAEVIPTEAGYDRLSQVQRQEGDVIADSQLYEKIAGSADWDGKSDTIVEGVKYHRMNNKGVEVFAGGDGFYKWLLPGEGDLKVYFKYEPIKWRVLEVKGNQALLLADQVLEAWIYNSGGQAATWETSAARRGTQSFAEKAFTTQELNAIVDTSLENKANMEYGTPGGNPTVDKVFLLSEDDVYGNKAAIHCFDASMPRELSQDKARACKSSTYAKAKKVHSDTREGSAGNCNWWLRTPGAEPDKVVEICTRGEGNPNGAFADNNSIGLRPAMWINLSAADYKPAGTVKVPVMGTSGTTSDVKVTAISISGISRKVAAGKKITLTASVKPSNASNKKMIWKSSDTGVAKVSQSGVVTMNKKSGGKSVVITAEAADGSKVAAKYKITSMKGAVTKVTISGQKSVKAGKTLNLKAVVKASKKANTKLKWTSSNKKYATVSSSGKVKTSKAGKGKKVKITAAATDGSGKKTTVTITIKK